MRSTEYREINAEQLRIGDIFTLDANVDRSTKFPVVYTGWGIDGKGGDCMEVYCSQDSVLSLIMEASRVVYLLAPTPVAVKAYELTIGDRYGIYRDGEIFIVQSVVDGSALDKRIPMGESTFVFFDGLNFHSISRERFIYRFPPADWFDRRNAVNVAPDEPEQPKVVRAKGYRRLLDNIKDKGE